MGRKMKPRSLHLLDGTARGSGKLKGMPRPATGRWNCPGWLLPEGRAFHKEFWPVCKAMGTVTIADKARWFNLAQRWAMIRRCEAEIARDGLSVKGRSGELKRHPSATILKSEQDLFRRECDVFGIGHDARAKMGLQVHTGKKSRMEELID